MLRIKVYFTFLKQLMAQTNSNVIKKANERVSMGKRPFEVALGKENCGHLTELLHQAEYGQDGIGKGLATRENIVQIMDYHLQIMQFIQDNYFITNTNKSDVEYIGPIEKVDGEDCYTGYTNECGEQAELPPLPLSKWTHYMEHIETIVDIHLFGADPLASMRKKRNQ